MNNGNFKTLVTALQTANLVTTLKGNGPFTVFAPTDAAFAKLPAGTVANLLRPENKQTLTQILTYHVLMGNITAQTITSLPLPIQINTLANSRVLVSRYGQQLKVNDATVIAPNVFARNGVIHAIDTVLLPH